MNATATLYLPALTLTNGQSYTMAGPNPALVGLDCRNADAMVLHHVLSGTNPSGYLTVKCCPDNTFTGGIAVARLYFNGLTVAAVTAQTSSYQVVVPNITRWMLVTLVSSAGTHQVWGELQQ